jgi:cytoskeleton protein RodZ
MTSIGEILRRERQRRNLELAKISGELRISVRFLEAIEAEDFGKLPGGVFTKSFVRQYASFLGLDGDEMAAEVQHAVEPAPEIVHAAAKPKPDVPLIQLQFDEDWQSVGERHTPWPSWITAAGLLVALMLVCSGVYWWWEMPHHAAPAHPVPPVARVAPAQPSAPPAYQPPANPPEAATAVPATDSRPADPLPAPAPPVNTAALPASAAASPAATGGLPVSQPNPNATVRVAITADEPVWIRAEVNGKYQFSGVLQAHESRSIAADGEVKLRLGNAGGATITLNGKPIGAVGPKGQIREVQFTSGGFQIVSSKPADVPLDRL